MVLTTKGSSLEWCVVLLGGLLFTILNQPMIYKWHHLVQEMANNTLFYVQAYWLCIFPFTI
jgi:hypothetical protein